MRPVRRQSSQAFEDRRDGLPEALSLSAAPSEGCPILPEKTAEYKATYSRRRLTENGLSSVDLESRFYAVLSKAAQVA